MFKAWTQAWRGWFTRYWAGPLQSRLLLPQIRAQLENSLPQKIHKITVHPAFQGVQVQLKILNFKSHPCWEYKFHAKLKYRKRGGKRFAGMVWSRKEDKETKEKKNFFWLHCAACGIKPAPPALGAWSLNYCMRQVPKVKFLFYSLFGSLHSQVPST